MLIWSLFPSERRKQHHQQQPSHRCKLNLDMWPHKVDALNSRLNETVDINVTSASTMQWGVMWLPVTYKAVTMTLSLSRGLVIACSLVLITDIGISEAVDGFEFSCKSWVQMTPFTEDTRQAAAGICHRITGVKFCNRRVSRGCIHLKVYHASSTLNGGN